ncbi:hypothetical protein [Brachybacterium sp. UMB0905]|uniref:hypothetical protein n=1 Tax=Brachybacterium sp. UMB0905 TaxID=2069310 RepID=UPI000C807E11|nr:hypothetical protein [Brachybacterium sp. UMB0905]PMC75563.1 hypothetical protein CJ197_07395 [Brachybacterium sp. UMB0905]
MASTSGPAEPRVHDDRPTRTFGPPASVVIGTLVTALVFVVVLEFLVIISFVGQRLWRDEALFRDALFTLPLVLWVIVAVLATAVTLRVLTAWLQVDEEGFTLRSLLRTPRTATWQQVGRVIAVRDISRGTSAGEMLDAPDTLYDGVYVMDPADRRMLAVPSRLFGPRAQDMVLQRAREAQVRIDHIDAITPAELRQQVPQAMNFVDRHPQLLLLALVAFYAGHNLLTFIVWGL